MKIATYDADLNGDVQAITVEEFRANPEILADAEEYVWQDQPDKATAIARHDEAFAAWQRDIANFQVEKDTY